MGRRDLYTSCSFTCFMAGLAMFASVGSHVKSVTNTNSLETMTSSQAMFIFAAIEKSILCPPSISKNFSHELESPIPSTPCSIDIPLHAISKPCCVDSYGFDEKINQFFASFRSLVASHLLVLVGAHPCCKLSHKNIAVITRSTANTTWD